MRSLLRLCIQELRTFAKHVVRSFFETAQKNNKVFMEIFFYTNVKDSIELQDGYGTYSS